MSDRLSDLEARVARLAEALERTERRLAVLEARPPAAPRRPAAAPHAGAAAVPSAAAVGQVVALAGRTLLVLAGAFLLRAITESGRIPAGLGVAAGFLYAGAQVALAGRTSPGRPLSAAFHGASAVLIGFPLLFEAATRFRLLAPAAAVALLAAFTGVALGVAAGRRIAPLAWIATLGGIGAAAALTAATGAHVAAALYLVALGAATLWIGYVLDWTALRWPAALAANAAVLHLALRAVGHLAPVSPGGALLAQLAILALYLGSIAVRTLLLHRSVVPFEVVQTAAVLIVGLGGAIWVAAQSGQRAGGFGVATALLGLAAGAVAFAFLAPERRGNFAFYTAVSIALLLAGTGLLLPGAARAIAWAALALAAAGVARARRRAALAASATAYAVAAALASGLLAGAAAALFGAPESASQPTPAAALVAWAAAGAVALLGAPATARWERAQRLLLVALVAAGAAGIAVRALAPLLAAPSDAAAIAAIRTAVLVGGAFALALAGRRDAWREAGWLAWPLLGVLALKLVLEDLPHSRPATLFVSFALYGAALLAVPRLRRRGYVAAPVAPPDA
jgi:hypothetical protein